MIDVQLAPDGYRVLCIMRPPGIYLDHCAVREISDCGKNHDARTVFLEYFKSAGTLFFSPVNALELASNSGRTLDDTLSFFQAVGPRWCPLNPNYVQVMEREAVHDAEHARAHPAMDEVFVRTLLPQVLRLRPSEIRRPSLATNVEILRESEDVRSDLKRMASELKTSISQTIRSGQQRWNQQPPLRKSGFPIPKLTHRTKTHHLYIRLVRRVMRESFDENDAMDLLHTIVAVAHADFVVLDRRWTGLIRSLRLPDGFARVFNIAEIRNDALAKALVEFSVARPTLARP